MILSNLGQIVVRNYATLVRETEGTGRYPYVVVAFTFGLFPILMGIALGFTTSLWTEIVRPLLSVIGVLTGFSINALVLITGQDNSDSYEIKGRVVEQTQDFTLYSILSGILLLVVITFGYVATNMAYPAWFPWKVSIPVVEIASVFVYTALIHYFLILLVISHRLYTLVHGDALT